MQMVDNLKQIVEYVCENFENLDMDDPVEEGYLDDYEEILGETEEEISAFEEKLGISLPEDVKELYRYKNGSKFFSLSHDFWNLGDRVLNVYPDIESLSRTGRNKTIFNFFSILGAKSRHLHLVTLSSPKISLQSHDVRYKITSWLFLF